MTSTVQELPPEGMLRAAVDALLAESPAELDPHVALCRAQVVLHESERLAAAALASIADLDERELFALDGAGSTRGWLRQQPAGDQGQLSLARRLRLRAAVRSALESGTIDTRAATSVCTSLASVDDLEAGTGLGGGIAEDQVHGVLVNAVPDLLRAWTGFGDPGPGDDDLPGVDADLRNEVLGRRALLAQVLTEAAEGIGLPVSQRLEPVFTVMARALSPHALVDALTTILSALEPQQLQSEDEAFEAEMHVTLVKRRTRGWDLTGVLDDEDGQRLHDDRQARLRLLTGDSAVDAHEAPDGEDGDRDGDGDEPDADDRFGAAGPGVEPLPWDHRRPAPVEGRALDGGVVRKKGYAAFRMMLHDRLAEPGTGTPTPAQLTVVVNAAFLTGQAGAGAPVLDSTRLTHLTQATLTRLGCDSQLSAVILHAAGRPLAASGTHRSFTRRERRALRAQWGSSCAVNGCGLPGVIPHHVEMFSRTGRTLLADGIPLCQHHHRDVHEGKRTLRLRDGRLVHEDGWVQQKQARPPDRRAA